MSGNVVHTSERPELYGPATVLAQFSRETERVGVDK